MPTDDRQVLATNGLGKKMYAFDCLKNIWDAQNAQLYEDDDDRDLWAHAVQLPRIYTYPIWC